MQAEQNAPQQRSKLALANAVGQLSKTDRLVNFVVVFGPSLSTVPLIVWLLNLAGLIYAVPDKFSDLIGPVAVATLLTAILSGSLVGGAVYDKCVQKRSSTTRKSVSTDSVRRVQETVVVVHADDEQATTSTCITKLTPIADLPSVPDAECTPNIA